MCICIVPCVGLVFSLVGLLIGLFVGSGLMLGGLLCWLLLLRGDDVCHISCGFVSGCYPYLYF